MRKWINLIEGEGLPPIIYHGTSLRALIRILSLDTLTPGCDDADMEGVFCSADPQVAARYMPDATYSAPKGGVMAFDTGKLSQAGYSITSYHYYEGDDGEEWVICGSSDIRPVHRFLHDIAVDPDAVHHLRDDISCAYVEEEWENPEDYHRAAGEFLNRFS